MTRFSYGTVRESPRRAIFVVRVNPGQLGPMEVEDIAERMRERLATRGEPMAQVVVVQGDSKETLRLHGDPYSVSRVRDAMFHAAIRWMALDLD